MVPSTVICTTPQFPFEILPCILGRCARSLISKHHTSNTGLMYFANRKGSVVGH